MRRILVVCALFLAIAPAAAHAASVPIRVLGPGGHVFAGGGPGSFSYPEGSGFVVHVGSSSVTRAGVQLNNVSLLGGRVQAGRVFVPRHGHAAKIGRLYVDGRHIAAKVNRLIPLSSTNYLITSQAAVAAGGRNQVGLVGLRLSLGTSAFGLKAGSQVLVGLPVKPSQSRAHTVASLTRSAPLAMLGFTGDGPGISDPAPISFFAAGPIGRQAAAIAVHYLGIPYLWGGSSPFTGFDCSGLVMYVYAKLGIHLTHYTGAQIHEGIPVPRAMLRPGDIVFFFAHNGVPDHEGMYIGNGQFIQAPHTGDVVKISSLSDPQYALGYAGAVRPYRF
jgi:cell wall-associated NlpC family hydrolase